ncbi:MAG: DUF4105 domain-containing protein [Gammaproteobacteria bacterium]|nr:DUF4105 domain-containing protein [Gammaproteobacteria bacterium]
MRKISLTALLALCSAFSSPAAHAWSAAPAAVRISLLTFGPGQIYWERFGHNAILVRDPRNGEALVYNYGIFDFSQKNFFLNFARGVMRYRIAADPLGADLAMYAAEGRSVTEQALDLSPAQSGKLARFLAWNARPENAQYAYDYFVDNCSTRVRDALDLALGGILHRQLTALPAAHNYRFEATRLIWPDHWLMLGMDVALGPAADRPLNLWQESFIPMVLARALRQVAVTDAAGHVRPLVVAERVLLPGALPPAPAAPPDLRLPFLLAGLTLAAMLLWLARAGRGAHRWPFTALAGTLWLICGLGGLVLAAMWSLTEHWAAWGNENLLLLDPLCLSLPWLWRRVDGAGRWLATLVALLALASLPLRLLPGAYQHNLAFIALLAPPHLALASAAWRRGRTA